VTTVPFRLIVAAAALGLAVPTSFAGADNTATASANEPAATAASPDVKPNRLRFRSAAGTCACTCAKGGMSEAEIRKAEEARIGTKD
jgi:hypothetical protein